LVVVDWYYSYSDHYCIDHMNHTSQFLQIEQTTQNGFPSHNLWIINDESYFFINFGDPWLVWKLKGLCRSTLGKVKSIFLIIEWSIYNNDSIIETCFMDSRTVRLDSRLKRYVGPLNLDLWREYFDQYIWLLVEYVYHHLWNDWKLFRFVNRSTQDVDVLAVLDFQNPYFRPKNSCIEEVHQSQRPWMITRTSATF